ncbi:MAG: hypothetical protein K5768_03610 [Firmicutes bacterium]|nr:hypothetical protein [Bacillota bacterium]
MLEPIFKGLVEWIYGIMVDIMTYASTELLSVMSMDLEYFEETAPIILDIRDVFIALGWALLIGNLLFQSLKAMISGIGFESEDPKLIFFRTFIFSFLLLASRQICDIGLGITTKVIELLQLPSSIEVRTPDESMFSMAADAKWMLVIIVGIVLMVQMVKLLFEIGERYVITSILTFFAPLAFSMGGSRNTNDVFKGWVRMYCSMLVMMIMNIVFLKLIMSAMSRMASGSVLIWLVFVVALTRVARKIDSHIGKIGLNPAETGNGMGSRLPGMMSLMAVRVISSAIGKSISGTKGSSGRNGRNSTPYGRMRNNRGGGFGTSNNRNTSHSTDSYSAGSSNRQGTTERSSATVHSAHIETKSGNAVEKGHNRPNAEDTTSHTSVQKGKINGKSKQNGKAGARPLLRSKISGESHVRESEQSRPPLKRDITSNTGKYQNEYGVNGSKKTEKISSISGISDDKSMSHSNSLNISGSERTVIRDRSVESKSMPEFNQQNTDYRATKYKKERTDRTFAVNENVGRQERINPEYPRGRHNPAAVNKKKKNGFYQKRNYDDNNINKGKENGKKHKR